MNRPDFPSYLKLHTEPLSVESIPPVGSDIAGLDRLQTAFEGLTGWSVRLIASDAGQLGVVWSGDVGDPPGNSRYRLTMQAGTSDQGTNREPSRTPIERTTPVLESIQSLLNELLRTRRALREREAELAVGVPFVEHSAEEDHLAERLESVLRAGAEAIGCQAAALYLLDDGTSELKLRAGWGLPKTRFLEPARPLRGALADLEALLGHAVALEDARLESVWNIPEDFAAALCVPVSSPTVPLGTLWFFNAERRPFSSRETELAEIIAGRLSADLERQVLLSHARTSRNHDRQLTTVARRQQLWMPQFAPMVDGWELAAWSSPAGPIGGDFFDWTILPDGDLALGVGDADGPAWEAAQTATLVYAALKAHSAYRHNAQQMLERVHETIWTSSAGDQLASLAYAKIHADRGDLEWASAGNTMGVVLQRKQWQVLRGSSVPLGTHPEPEFCDARRRIPPGGVLVLCSGGFWDTRNAKGENVDPIAVAGLLRHRRNASAQALVDDLRAYLEQWRGDGPATDATILVAKRNDATTTP